MRWTDSDRVLPGVIYPTTDGLTSGVRHQKGARRPSFGDGFNLSQARAHGVNPF
jgi:hypothetical protein